MKIMSTFQQILNHLYKGCLILSGLFFVSVALLNIYDLFAPFLGHTPRSANEFSGYCMGASAFLAMGYTLRSNEHIRVNIIIRLLPQQTQRILNFIASLIAIALTGYLTWFSIDLTLDSWIYYDVSQGLIALPLWIPQSSMAIGCLVFLLATVEQLFSNITDFTHAKERSSHDF